MSALIRQSHSNNEQPLWASASGSGAPSSVSAVEYDLVTSTGAPANCSITNDTTTNGVMCLRGQQIRFGPNNTTNGNSYILPSAPGSQLDSMTVGGAISTNGTLNSAGLTLKNSQYISILDGGAPTQNEVLRISAVTTGAPYPDGATVTFQTGVDGAFQFGALGQLPQTYIIPGSGPGADQMAVGGGLSVDGLLQVTQVQMVNDDPANGVFGTATLTGGEVVVTTNQADINSLILLTRKGVNASTTLGELRIRQQNVGSFIITSAQIGNPQTVPQAGDVSDVQWIILNPYQSP